MTRRTTAVVLAASIAAAVAVVALVGRRQTPREIAPPVAAPAGSDRIDDEAVARLRTVPFYRGLVRPEALRAASSGPGGTLLLEIDLPALLRTRLARAELEAVVELLPRTARGSVHLEDDGSGHVTVREESWLIDGPSPLLDLLARTTGDRSDVQAWDAIPGSPSAVAAAFVLATRLADPSFGGRALAVWRERAELAEHVLGRPLRAEIADDLAGPVVFALYEATTESQAGALLVVELKRSDRLRALLESVFALGALTERATVRRYRDVATGSIRPAGDGPGLAVAVDGPLLLAASSRVLLEGAIDARRGERRSVGLVDEVHAAGGSWNAVSASAFVAHGWARLARSQDPADPTPQRHDARLTPEGTTGWRLVGHGPGPAITADPILPFSRFAFAGRQRGAG